MTLDLNSNNSNGSNKSTSSTFSSNGESQSRLTKAVDIFSLGCLMYYVISRGKHPFGDRVEREVNILNNKFDLSALDSMPEAQDLISKMIQFDVEKRF